MDGKRPALPSRNSTAAESDLVADIYNAALEPALWGKTLNRISRAVGAKSSILYAVDLAEDATGFRTAVGVEPDWHVYDTYYASVDPFISALLGAKRGLIYSGDDLVNRQKYERSEFCADFMGDMDIFHVVGGLVQESHRSAVLWGLQRPQRRNPFGDREKAILQNLFPHMGRAVALQQRLGRASQEMEDQAVMLDRIDLGILRCDRHARLLYVNRTGEEILQDSTALGTERGILTAATLTTTHALRATIARMADGERHGECSLPLPRPDGPPVAAAVAPLSDRPGTHRLSNNTEPAVLVMLRDPLRDPEQPVARLQSLFALSPAEARMAWMLTAGKSMQEIAPTEGVTRETARTRLKLIFGKVGVHRQAELVSLLRSSLSR